MACHYCPDCLNFRSFGQWRFCNAALAGFVMMSAICYPFILQQPMGRCPTFYGAVYVAAQPVSHGPLKSPHIPQGMIAFILVCRNPQPYTRPLMRWRPLHLALLLFEALWLNVVVPGHTRGIIPLAGSPCCCACHRSAPCDKSHPRPAQNPDNCAICAFAARITPPPAIDLVPPFLRRVALAIIPAPPCPTLPPVLIAYDGRAPPATG
jgi:hypothetical protein